MNFLRKSVQRVVLSNPFQTNPPVPPFNKGGLGGFSYAVVRPGPQGVLLKRLVCWVSLCGVLAALSGNALAEQGAPPQGSKRLPRSYEGAPPLIPHDAEARKGVCLSCHGIGVIGAPIVPHPTRNHFCLQCHIGQDLSVQAFPAAPSQEEKKPK